MTKKATYMIDDSFIFDIIEETLANIDKGSLEKIKNNKEVNNNYQELYNLEEEELEEDDFHYEDLD